jgi:hypothetical protein
MPGLGDYEKKKEGERGYKMGTPTLLKMVSALKNKEEKHFLEKEKVGPIATEKPFDPESYFIDKDLDDALHRKHAEITYTKDHPYEDEMDRDEPVGDEIKSIGVSSQIKSKMKKSKKKKY